MTDIFGLVFMYYTFKSNTDNRYILGFGNGTYFTDVLVEIGDYKNSVGTLFLCIERIKYVKIFVKILAKSNGLQVLKTRDQRPGLVF